MSSRKLILLSASLIGALLLQPTTTRPMATVPAAPASAATVTNQAPAVEADYGQMPLYFIDNQGQMDEQVAYYIQGRDKTIYFSPGGVTFALTAQETLTDTARGERPAAKPARLSEQPGMDRAERTAPQRWTVKLEFVGADPDVRPVAEEQAEAVFSYFAGTPNEWHAGLLSYRRLVYRELWPGIDLVYSGTVSQMKYEFIVKPGADPDQIRLAYRGATEVKVNAVGQMEVSTPIGGFQDDTPVAYQDVDGQRVSVSMTYDLDLSDSPGQHALADSSVKFGFAVGNFDSNRPLVLDPAVLVYAGYIGEVTSVGWSGDIAVDEAGNAYVTGFVSSSQATFPVLVGPDLTYNGGTEDAFIAKVNAAGTALLYVGYIGGAGSEWGRDIAVDGAGNAYVTGTTHSSQTTFPVSVGPDTTFNGGADAYVAKVNAAGTALLYAGYIGGWDIDEGYGIAVDEVGNAYVVGVTYSDANSFPVLIGPDLTHNGWIDVFVTKVNEEGTSLLYSGYIGTGGPEMGKAIAVDGLGNAYVAGETSSAAFPVLVGPDLTSNGNDDAFVAKVNAAGTGLVYAGYIGGEDREQVTDIAVDGVGNAYVTGATRSSQTTFPVSVGPDLTHNGNDDAFLAKVNTTGTALAYAGYIGGASDDYGSGIAVDEVGNAYVSGKTSSSQTTFPVLSGPDPTYNGNTDAFVAKVNTTGTALLYAGYIGGSNTDEGVGVAVDVAGNTYVVGTTTSHETTFPVLGGPDLTFNGGMRNAFVAKVSETDTAHSISGRVTSNNLPLAGVVVSAGAGGSATTDANGDYTIANVRAGTYTLTPIKSGTAFSPARRTGVTVPPTQLNMDFVASILGTEPTPFLDLPVPYDGTSDTFHKILQDSAVKDGRINSWFDHSYPDRGSDCRLWIYNLKVAPNPGTCIFSTYAYDGHNGLDFKGSEGLEIQAAAEGDVKKVVTGCEAGKPECGDGFGNFVVLYHPIPGTNGYFTLYGHLSAVTVATGAHVLAGDPIGAMGHTGYVEGNPGTHLHFGVYRDNNGEGVWQGTGPDKPVDPYGWRLNEADPWVTDPIRLGPVSYRLWIHDPAPPASTNGPALTIVSTTQNVTANIPANRFPGQATLELLPGPVAGPSAQLRQAGQTFWLTLLEWIQGLGAAPGALPADGIAAADPITLTVQYSEAQSRHLNMSQAAIYRWDEAAATWQALPTTLDSQTRTLTALSPDVGQFSPQAPLLCPADTAEPDDDLYRAMTLSLGGASTSHILDGAGDEDWFVWEAQAGVAYVIQTQGLTAGVDTVLEIRDVTGQTVLASDDNSGGGAASRLKLTLTESNLYFARVIPAAGSATGCASSYAINLYALNLFLPALSR